MKSLNTTCKWILALALVPVYASAELPNKTVLPDQLKVYYNEKVGLSTKQFKGSSEKVVPMDNEFKDAPGCYVACYSKNKKDAAYYLMDGVYMMGQIRVAGRYTNGICLPKGFESKDLPRAKDFKEKCEKSFPTQCEKGACWADGHTGNLFY